MAKTDDNEPTVREYLEEMLKHRRDVVLISRDPNKGWAVRWVRDDHDPGLSDLAIAIDLETALQVINDPERDDRLLRMEAAPGLN